MEPIISAPRAEGDGGDAVKDSDTASFQADVLDASHRTPVIVDFWAPWCGPCKQLGPALEKVVRGTGGAVRLVKINVDQNQELAAQLRIQSIPAVYAFVDGRPVDGFVGALPESQIRAFVDRLARAEGPPSPVDDAVEQAKAALERGETAAAANIFSQVLAHDPANVAARAGLARCAIADGELEQARRALDGLPAEADDDPEVAAVRTALELAEAGRSAGDTAALRERLERDPNDQQARYDLALALFGTGQTEEAIDQLLELVRRDRAWNDEAARKQLLKIFEALGPGHALTQYGRRRLSSILFS